MNENDDKLDLQEVIISEALICHMIRMRINKLKNERRQNLNHLRKFSITKMLHNLQHQRKDMMKKKYVCISMCTLLNLKMRQF